MRLALVVLSTLAVAITCSASAQGTLKKQADGDAEKRSMQRAAMIESCVAETPETADEALRADFKVYCACLANRILAAYTAAELEIITANGPEMPRKRLMPLVQPCLDMLVKNIESRRRED